MSATLLLALLLSACTGSVDPTNSGLNNGGDADADSDADVIAEVTFSSSITYASREGDEIVTSEVATDGISFVVEDADKATWSAETVYTDSLVLGACTATVDHTDAYGVHWISDRTNIGSAAVQLKPCVDLTGTWSCYDVGAEDNVNDFSTEMTWCEFHLMNKGGNEKLDGNHFTSENYDGFVSQDGKTLDLNYYGNTGTYFGITYCDKQ